MPLAWPKLVAWLRDDYERRLGVRLTTPGAEDKARAIYCTLGLPT